MGTVSLFSTMSHLDSNSEYFLPQGATFGQTFTSAAGGVPVELGIQIRNIWLPFGPVDVRVRLLRGGQLLFDCLPYYSSQQRQQDLCLVIPLRGIAGSVAQGDAVRFEVTPVQTTSIHPLNFDIAGLQRGSVPGGYPPFNSRFYLTATDATTAPFHAARGAIEHWALERINAQSALRADVVANPRAVIRQLFGKELPGWAHIGVHEETPTKMVLARKVSGWSPGSICDPACGKHMVLCHAITTVCHTDAQAAAQLRANPTNFLNQRFGFAVPSGVAVDYVEENGNSFEFVMPHAPHYEAWQIPSSLPGM